MIKNIVMITFIIFYPLTTHGAETSATNTKLKSDDFLECSVTYATFSYHLENGDYKNKEKLDAIHELALMSGSVAQSLSPSSIEEKFKTKLQAELKRTRNIIKEKGFDTYYNPAQKKMNSCSNLIKSNSKEIYRLLTKKI